MVFSGTLKSMMVLVVREASAEVAKVPEFIMGSGSHENSCVELETQLLPFEVRTLPAAPAEVRPVPPWAAVTAAAEVRTVAFASGNTYMRGTVSGVLETANSPSSIWAQG